MRFIFTLIFFIPLLLIEWILIRPSVFAYEVITETYIGYGWVLIWNKNEQAFFVKVRLIKGPAARIKPGWKVLSINGKNPAEFPKNEDGIPILPRAELGEQALCRLETKDGLIEIVRMTAKQIWCGVPSYGHWRNLDHTTGFYRHSIFVPWQEPRTGAMYMRRFSRSLR